jgi:pyruvate dehydrogenase E2 component (dihydrolipoamide acetyltransferase)
MIKEVTLPEISENVESGEIIKVLVSVGDAVEVDQPLLELETEKAVLEVPSPYKGKIAEIRVRQGDTLKIGEVFMTIDTADVPEARTARRGVEPEAAPPVPSARRETAPARTPETPEAGPRATPAIRGTVPDKSAERPERAPLASPAVRRLARELGVDIHKVAGTGEGGRVLEHDLKEFAKNAVEGTAPGPESLPGAAAEPGRWGAVVREPMTKVRQVTARSMAAAWSTVPHVTHYDRADTTALDAALKKYSPRVEKAGGKLTITAVLVKIAASALGAFPKFNASIDTEKQEIVYKKYCHIGVAVDTDRGLLVPVIRDADRKNITQISVELGILAAKARDRKISPEELEGGTFTVSNLGGIGGTGFSPIVYAPQVAILGVARARTEPVYIDGRWEPRLMLPLSVSYDHRLIDGADAARFVRWIAEALENPILMWLGG